MGKLMQSLGLGNVSSDVNEIADGKYDAVVDKSEYFFNKAKDTVSHVITYRIESNDPATKGRNKQEYFTLGKEPRDASGNFAKDEESLAAYNNTQTEMNKQFHKKRFVDLLATPGDAESRKTVEARVDNGDVDAPDLVGVHCTINIKTNNGYQNVAGAWARGAASAPVATTQAVTLGSTPETNATPQSPEAPPAPSGITGIAGGL